MTVVRMFRCRLLDLLIVLAVAFWFPQFWLAEKIIRHRSRSRGGDDESKNVGRRINSSPITQSPHTEAALPPMALTCYPIQFILKKSEEARR